MTAAVPTKYRIIEVPCHTSLYDPAVSVVLSEALEFFRGQEINPDHDIVIFDQKMSGSDYHSEWVLNASTLLYHELNQNLHNLRSLIKFVLRARMKTAYVFQGNCLDSFFELAMAVDFRVAYDNRGYVGFPQIEKGFYPGGGIFDRIAKTHALFKFDWRKRTRFSIDEALAVGLVHGCFIGDISSVVKTLERRPKQQYDSPVDLPIEMELPFEHFSPSKLSELTKGVSNRLFVQNLIHKPQKIVQRFETNHKYRGFLASLSAYQYLTQKYSTYLKKNISFVENEVFSSHLFSVIYIELEEVIPPADFIATMLSRCHAICFYCTQIDLLQSNLSLLYDRLGSVQNAPLVYQRWNQKARWIVGLPLAKECLHISYHADRRVTFAYGEQKADFFAVDVSGAVAEVHPSSDRWERNFYHLFGLVLELPKGVFKDISLATYLRSLFFEELLKYSTINGLRLTYIIQSLSDRGWRFAGSWEAWDTFIGSRHILSDLPPEPIGGFTLSKTAWSLETLHKANFEVKRVKKDFVERTPIELDSHFRYLAGITSLVLAKNVLGDDHIKAELFVSEILGFPTDDHMPLDGMRYCRMSTQSYVAKNWPNYMDTLTGEF